MKKKIQYSVAIVMFVLCLVIWGIVIGRSKDSNSEKEAVADPTEQFVTGGNVTENITGEPGDNRLGDEEATTGKQEEHEDIKLIMVGDMLMHDGVQNTGLKEDGTYNYDHLFVHLKNEIQSADIAVVNQETIIGGAEYGIKGYPRFNCLEEVADAIETAGFDIVLHATNHTLDQGEEAIEKCMKIWDERHPHIKYLGIHKNATDYNNVYIHEQNGMKIAMLNYTYSLNGLVLDEDCYYMVDMLDEEKIRKDMEYASANADFVIVYPHWGTEYVYEPDSSQLRWAQLFADCGADLVIGTHPHVIEPVRYVEGEKGNRTLVYYSLGNYVSTQDKAPRMLGAMAEVTIGRDDNGEVVIKDYGVEPLVTHIIFRSPQLTTYKLSEYTQELAAQNYILRYDASFSIDLMKQLCKDVFGELYKAQ